MEFHQCRDFWGRDRAPTISGQTLLGDYPRALFWTAYDEPRMTAASDPGKTPVRSLLLVEDSSDDVFFMRRALRVAGIATKIIHLSSGHGAIHYFSTQAEAPPNPDRPALMFLDIKLPDLDGFEVLRWLRKHPDLYPGLVVVMLTTSDQDRDIRLAQALRVHEFATKPPTAQLFNRIALRHGLEWLRLDA